MAEQIGEIVVKFSADVAELRTQFDQVTQRLKTLEAQSKTTADATSKFEAVLRTLGGTGQTTERVASVLGAAFGSLVGPVGLALAAFAAVEEVVRRSTGAFLEHASEIKRLMIQTGLGAQQTNQLATAFELAGVSTAALQTSMFRLGNAIDQGSPALTRLHISIRDGAGFLKSEGALFLEIRDRLSEVADASQRTALIMQLFGRSGRELAPIFALTREEFVKFLDKAGLLSQVSDESQKKASDLAKAQRELSLTFKTLWEEVGEAVAGPMTALSKMLTEIIQKQRELNTLQTEVPPEVLAGARPAAGLMGLRQVLRGQPSAGVFGPPAERLGPPGQPEGPLEQFGPPSPGMPQPKTPGEIREAEAEAKAVAEIARAEIALGQVRDRVGATAIQDLQNQIRANEELLTVERRRMDAIAPFQILAEQQSAARAERAKIENDAAAKRIELGEKLKDAQFKFANTERMVWATEEEAVRQALVALDLWWEKQQDIQKQQDKLAEEQRTMTGTIGIVELTDSTRDALTKLDQYVAKPFDDLNLAMATTRREAAFFGSAFDEVGANVTNLTTAINTLHRQQRDIPADLQAQYEHWQRLADILTEVHSIIGSFGQAFNTAIQSLIQGSQSAAQAFAAMGRNIAASLVENVINQGIKQVEKALDAFIKELYETGLLKQAIQAGVGALLGLGTSAAAPGGGGEGGFGSMQTVQPYLGQHGGIITQPTNLIAGEAGPEALIPLHNAPGVQALMPQVGGQPLVVVNIETPPNTEAKTSTTQNGRQQIHNIIITEVRAGLAGGEVDSDLSRLYGLRRQPTGR